MKRHALPRPEHPRPQFQRPRWINLNGPWSFAFDVGVSGLDREWHTRHGFEQKILVPFCPESALSGVGYTDFIPAVWYHRTFTLPPAWSGARVLLHFGGVDYECHAFVDGVCVGRHTGGSASFTFDITAHARPGHAQHLVVYARDDQRGGAQAYGKQSAHYYSHGCSYTRTTGIWQTVWLEAADLCGLQELQIVADTAAGAFVVTPSWYATRAGLRARFQVNDGKRLVCERRVAAAQGVPVVLPVPSPHLWSPDDPHLYGVRCTLLDERGRAIDDVRSYAGLRTIACEGGVVLLNNQPLYLRLVLDQGFYPDGVWTAPSDAALKHDIVLAQRAGFNGARLHQKVFEERFHYWADRLGYVTWGESASWGMDLSGSAAARNFLAEWRAIVVRDRNHPSIIAWTPFNETNPKYHSFDGRLQRDVYGLTKSLDPTRPVNDASGWCHELTDLFTVHNYEQDAAKLAHQLARDEQGRVWQWAPAEQTPHAGQPYIVDEFGGIKWIPPERRPHSTRSWGYGDAPKTVEEFYTRLEGQVAALLSHDHICGYCYTQLTDVEQEQNGIYNYDRSAKFDMRRIARIFRRTRAGTMRRR